MKRTIRIISMILSLITLLSLASCAMTGENDEKSDDSTVSTVESDVTVDDRYDENGYLKSDLPELDFKKETITVLWWTDVERPEFYVEQETADPVSDAIYARNAKVEEKLNIIFEWDGINGQYNNGVGAAYANYVGNSWSAGDTTWDLMSAHSRTMALTSQKGYCADLTDLDYLNFEMPWWPKVMTETAMIGDSLYYVTGDCSTNALHMMYTVFFNKALLENYKLEDPAQMVLNDTWTIEAMQTMCKDIYTDADSSGGKSDSDIYGLTTLRWHMDCLWYGADLMLIEPDEDDLFKVSPDFTSEKAANLCASLIEWINTEDIYVNSDHYRTPFVNGNALMCIARHKDVVDDIVDASFKFGILPAPKYTEQQKKYITTVGNPVSLYSVYVLSKDTNRAAAVLECWASEAYRTTTPALFEQTFKLRYSDTSTESEMYDIMRDGIVFDIGRFYHDQLGSMIDIFTNAVVNGDSWQSATKSASNIIDRALVKISDSYKKLADQ